MSDPAGPVGSSVEEIEEWLGERLTKLKVVLGALGFLFGVALSLGTFEYYRSEPVNALAVFGVLAGLPFVLTAVSALLLARAARARTSRPGAASPPDGVPARPERRIGLIQRLLFKETREALLRRASATRVTIANLGEVLTGPSMRIQNHFCLQWFGTLAVTGACLTFFGYLLIHDVGFGWSSTVFNDADFVQRFVAVASSPWSWAADVGPSLETIEKTQWSWADALFTESFGAAAAERQPEQWWPFLMLSVVVWGVLPRVLLLAFTGLFLIGRHPLPALRLAEEPAPSAPPPPAAKPSGGFWRRLPGFRRRAPRDS